MRIFSMDGNPVDRPTPPTCARWNHLSGKYLFAQSRLRRVVFWERPPNTFLRDREPTAFESIPLVLYDKAVESTYLVFSPWEPILEQEHCRS